VVQLSLQRKWPQIRCAPANGREWVGESIEDEQEIITQMIADSVF
jgi:hypothetical protein